MTIKKLHTTLLVPALWVSMHGCLDVAESRVERDESVGQAERNGTVVEVRDGLAVVRSLGTARLELWGSAPAFSFTLRPGARNAGDFSLSAENLMPGAELTLDGAPIEARDRPLATEAEWQLTLRGDQDHTLSIAAPDMGEQPFRFAQLNDVQDAIDGFVDLIARVNQETELDFVLGAGDLTSQGSAEELERFQAELKKMSVPYFATLGNHELGTDPPPYHQYFGRGSFSFSHRGVRFTLLDSASATIAPTVYEWLQAWLSQGRQQTHIVSMHIPPQDPSGTRQGAFASRNEGAKLLSQLRAGNVDLTLYGHIHTYIEFENAGIPARIVGGGGAIPTRGDRIGRHYLVVEAGAERGIVSTRLVRIDGDFDY